jgi:hypothetical protein
MPTEQQTSRGKPIAQDANDGLKALSNGARRVVRIMNGVMKAHYSRTTPPSLRTTPSSEGVKQPSNPSSEMEKSQLKAA